MGHGAAVGLFEDLDGAIVAAQQIQAHPQADAAGGGMVLAALQFADRVAEDRVLREIPANGLLHLPHFAGAKAVVGQDNVFQVEFNGLRHYRFRG